MRKLEGKVALITGAGSGIGRATALLFGQEGAKVVVVDCAEMAGRETVKRIIEAGGTALYVDADVSKASDAERMIMVAMQTYGRIDVLYNNAGIAGVMTRTAELVEEEWDSVLEINLKGVFLGSKFAVPAMIERGGGVVINTASAASLVASPGMPAYGASKAGVMQLTKTMALEYARQNIRVNCICPGMIETPMGDSPFLADAGDREAFIQAFIRTIPLGRIGKPEEVAKTALYLASDDSSYVTGTVLVVDGGVTAQ